MNNLFQDTLVRLINEHGIGLLDDTARLSALLNDHTKGQCKRDIRILSKLLEYNFHHAAQNAGDNFVLVQQQFTQRLYDDDGLEINTAKHVADILAIAIGVKEINELDLIKDVSTENTTNTIAATDYYEHIELFDFYLLGDTQGKEFVGKYKMLLSFKKYFGTSMCFSDGNGDKFRIKTTTRYDVIRDDICFVYFVARHNKNGGWEELKLDSISRFMPTGYAFDKIDSARKNGNWDMVIQYCDEFINIDPNYWYSFDVRGMAYANKEQFDLSIIDYSEAIRLDPNKADAYYQRGNAYYKKGDIDKAIANYTQAISLNPGYAKVYWLRGLAYSSKGDYDKVIADYTQVITLDPEFAMVYCFRGGAYSSKGDYDKAIADYTQAIKLDPNDALAYNNRGNAYGNKGDVDKAIADYNQAIKLDPNDALAYYNRGNAYDNKGDVDKAIADYNQAIKLDPNNAAAYYNRGIAYDNKDDVDKAIADYNQAIKLDPNNALAYARRGLTYYLKGDYDRAIADAQAALKINPNDEGAKERLEIARRRGR
jgi:tetratricopeptide (TPR) repeat protein